MVNTIVPFAIVSTQPTQAEKALRKGDVDRAKQLRGYSLCCNVTSIVVKIVVIVTVLVGVPIFVLVVLPIIARNIVPPTVTP